MLRKFLIPTVVVSILLLLTTLITLAKTETTAVVTPTTPTQAVTIAKTATTTTTSRRPVIIIEASAADSTETTVIHSGGNSNTSNTSNTVNKKLLNKAEETTTSLLPLQPPLNVTSTTLASFILNQQRQQQQKKQRQQQQQQPPANHQKHQQQQRQPEQRHQPQQQNKVKQLQLQQRQRQQQQQQQQRQQRHNRQPKQDVGETQQSQKHLINAPNGNDSQENLKKIEEEVSARVELVTPMPTTTHAYIPFDLDYNDPTEEKSRPPEAAKQTTINEVLLNLFPKGFSDIFRFSYAADPDPDADTEQNVAPFIPETTNKPTQKPIVVVKSTPMPFKAMPTVKNSNENPTVKASNTPIPFKPMPTEKQTTKEPKNEENKRETPTPLKPKSTDKKATVEETKSNGTILSTFTTITREHRRETSPGHVEIVVEKFMTNPALTKSGEDFRDGSNSISKEELLRINRAAKEASVLPSLLVNPQDYQPTSNSTYNSNANGPIVILNENNNDDFVDAPQDDNQIAESQNFVQAVYDPPQSISYQQGPTHEINVHIVHDDNLRKAQDDAVQRRIKEQTANLGEQPRNFQSYQSFVEQAKQIQSSLKEAPSRKFLKNFNPALTQASNTSPVPKGNFHYEQIRESHIQTVPPAAQLQYVGIERPQKQQLQQQQPEQQVQLFQPSGPQSHYRPSQESQHLHTAISDSSHLSDKDAYETVDSDNSEPESVTPYNLVFVTINTPESPEEESQAHQQPQGPLLGPYSPHKTPQDYVYAALNVGQEQGQEPDPEPEQEPEPEPLPDHQPEESEDSPKPSGSDDGGGGGGYTFVEVQKSINIHNKLITEKDGRLIEQHETIYPNQHYGQRLQPQQPAYQEQHQHQPVPHEYVSLSQNPIHVPQEEQYESAASLIQEQHALDPSQSLMDIGPIQQSNLVQETHIIETPNQQGHYVQAHPQETPIQHGHYVQAQPQEEVQHLVQETHTQEGHYIQGHPQDEVQHHTQEHHHIEEHHAEVHPPPQEPQQISVQIPYAPLPDHYHHPHPQHHQHPLILQEVIEKHVHIPYPVHEPVGVPVHIQHFIDRPVPVETIVEKPVPYAVEKVVEKVVEKHVPVEVERIVEKPVVVEKYIDRPVAIPIKIPVALHMPINNPQYAALTGHYPLTYGGSAYSSLSPWSQSQSQSQSTLTRIPTKILQAYYAKMLKKLVPQMAQAYKTSPLASKTKMVAKFTTKPSAKHAPRLTDMRYDLKPPPPPPQGPSWDVGARYQYDYNTLPLDLSASSSTAVGKQAERPAPGFKTNFDEFQRWRNGHSLKRSPEFGMNLHMEYGFKPPLVPSVEIDDKGIPLKAAADLTKGKEE